MKRTRLDFYGKDTGIINGGSQDISRKKASAYFLKYHTLQVIQMKNGYYTRIEACQK